MGRTTVNRRLVIAPTSTMRVSELKQLADLPAPQKLYTRDGRILRDDEVVSTEDADYGAVTDWTRGRSG